MKTIIQKTYLKFLSIQAISTALIIAISFIDSLIVGKFLGSNALSAVGLITPLTALVMVITNVFAKGLLNVCSKTLGKKEYLHAGRQLSSVAILVTGIVLPLVIIVVLFPDSILNTLYKDSSSSLLFQAKCYLLSIAPMALVVIFPSIMDYMCQINNRPKWCIFATVTMFIIDISGDLIAVLFTNTGLFGVGLASSLSMYVGGLIMIFPCLIKKNTLKFRLGLTKSEFFSDIKSIVSFGLPSAISLLAYALSSLFINTVLIMFNAEQYIASRTCVFSIIDMLFILSASLPYCTSIITSSLVGSHMYYPLKKVPLVFFKLIIVCDIAPIILTLLTADFLTGLFVGNNPELHAIASLGLCIIACSIFLLDSLSCMLSFFRATNHPIAATTLILVSRLIILCPLILLFVFLFGPLGMFIAFSVSYFISTALMILVCSIRKKSSPLRSETYLFLPETTEDEYDEYNTLFTEESQMPTIEQDILEFYEKHGARNTECITIETALNDLLNSALIKNYIENKGKKMLCWIHASNKQGKLSVQVINTKGPFAKYFISDYVEKTRTPLEKLCSETRKISITVKGNNYYLDSVISDFLRLSCIELQLKDEKEVPILK